MQETLWADACLAAPSETIVYVISNYSNGGADIRCGVGFGACVGGRHGEKGRTGRREAGGRGAPLKAASEPLSDGLSTQHSCFRQSQGSGGSSGPFHLHMAFLRSRPSGMLALPHFTPSVTHRCPPLPTPLLRQALWNSSCSTNNCTVNTGSTHLACGNPSLCGDLSFMSTRWKVHSLSVVCVCAVRWMQIGRWVVAGMHLQGDVGRNEKQYKLEDT